MHPLIRALLSAWDWRLDISSVLAIFATLYTIGWCRLRKRSKNSTLANKKRLAAYLGGVATLAIALMSPIDPLGSQLFFMHMVQHKLVMMIAPPLLWLGDPFPFLLWGLPAAPRKVIGRLFTSQSLVRTALRTITQPVLVWFVFVTVYIGWHDPVLYNLALEHAWVHDLQHLTFFGAAMLFWWVVVGPAPYLQGQLSYWARIALVLTVIPPNMATGITIATADTVLYPYYETVPRVWGFSALDDQAMAGAIMWIPGSEMMVNAAIALLAVMLRQQGGKPPGPAPDWDREEAMIAPGLEHRVVQNKWRRLQAARQTLDS